MAIRLSDLRSAYGSDDVIVVTDLPAGTTRVLARSAHGTTRAGVLRGSSAELAGVCAGTHAFEARGEGDTLLAEEFFGVRDVHGEDPVMGFVTSFGDDTREDVLSWLRDLRCTVVQVYDWMNSYSVPLASGSDYLDPLGRPISKGALEALIRGIRELGAVAQAYAPVLAAGDDVADEQPTWRLFRNDDIPESLGKLLQIMNPGSAGWQDYWIERYGAACDELGFDGLHLDTYGYPRNALSNDGVPVSLESGFEGFVRAVRAVRPNEVLSFNQVNGVPRGFEPPDSPSFRYVEVWPPNNQWRHLEGLLQRSAGTEAPRGDTLALYPPVWDGDRVEALRTAVLSEAVVTILGANTLIWGDDHGVLSHPYYVTHESLSQSERATVLEWHRFNLRCRDLFRSGTDTSWYELADENASVGVEWDGDTAPEPVGGALFARIRRSEGFVAVSLLDLTGSPAGAWTKGTGEGRCKSARVTVLLDEPRRWTADVAELGRVDGRFLEAKAAMTTAREGRALEVEVSLASGWSVLRLSAAETTL